MVRGPALLMTVLMLMTLAAPFAGSGFAPEPQVSGITPVTPQAPDPLVAAAIARLDSPILYSTIFDLQNFTTRHAYTAQGYASGLWIADELRPYIDDIRIEPFVWSGYPMFNVIATINGTGSNPDVYTISAHYDSTGLMSDAPGADDDASGTAAVIRIAQIMSDHEWNATLKLILFGGEEIWFGMMGSRRYTMDADANGEQFNGTIQLDMIGYSGGTPQFTVVYTEDGDVSGTNSTWLAQALVQAEADYSIGIPMQLINRSGFEFEYSDHAPFWWSGWDAVLGMESDDPRIQNPYYHGASDLIQYIDIDQVRDIGRVSMAALADTTGIMSGDIVGPRIMAEDPAPGSTTPNTDPPIRVRVRDPYGTDLGSIRVWVDGIERNFTTTPTHWGYDLDLEYLDFPVLSTVNVTVTALDLNGNPGGGYWEFSVDGVAPTPPLNVTATVVGDDVVLTWDPSAAFDAESYQVYFAADRTFWDWSNVRGSTTGLNWTDVGAGLTEGTRLYRVRTTDVTGLSGGASPPVVKHTVQLAPGWTLWGPAHDWVNGSVEGDLAQSGIRRAWAYPDSGGWVSWDVDRSAYLNSFSTLDHENGAWLNHTTGGLLTTTGPMTNMWVVMEAGWNLITYHLPQNHTMGFATTGLDHGGLWEQANPGSLDLRQLLPTDTLEMGTAYWIWMNSPGIWSVF